MDVGNDHGPKEQQEDQPTPTISIENETVKTEPITIDNGRRRPSQRSYTEHDKVRKFSSLIVL